MHQELQGICRRENSFLNWLGITIVAMFASFGRNRLPWLILAVVLMFASAICGLLYMDAVGKISGWIGVPGLEFEGKVSDRKSTRLNSSHTVISYAVFCLKKKKKTTILPRQ